MNHPSEGHADRGAEAGTPDGASLDLEQRIREMGSVITPAMFVDTSALMAPGALRPGAEVTIERNLAYGPHERHRLDIFVPSNGAAGKPVLLYVHGGGFVQGDKREPGQPFYDHIGAWAARIGAVGVTMNYRLAPQHAWPAGPEDIAAAVEFLQSELPARGGDPASIFLMGQSAGACHVAGFVAMTALHPAPPVAGAIMLSGIYDLTSFSHGPLEAAYYGTDSASFEAKSSLAGLVASACPCLFSIAEYDPPHFQNQAALLTTRWFAARGELPRLLYLSDQNHMSPALGVGRPGDLLSHEIEKFMGRYRCALRHP